MFSYYFISPFVMGKTININIFTLFYFTMFLLIFMYFYQN